VSSVSISFRRHPFPYFLGGLIVTENSILLHHRNNIIGAVRLWFCALLLALALPLASRAQDTGYISGTVTDKSGAAVVAADVVLTNAAGSLTRATTTNTDGVYVLAALPGDTYNLVVTAKGFQKYTAQKIVLNVAEKARIDVQLSVGAMTEEIVVTGESVAQVETTSSDLTSTITGKQIDQLVLNGRNFTQLVNLAPGVVNQTGQDEGTVGVYGNVAYAINGGRTEYNNWELDGGDNMDNGSNATLNVYPNPEAIAEFKVLTSNYGAQYGRNGSGTVEVETKSGGSSFHGSAFEYLRNEFFNARSWDQGIDVTQPKAPYKKHDFGYTIGGPVFVPDHYNTDKKKTFFFFSEEWRREKNPSTITQNVPSDLERSGNFTVLCGHDPADCPTGSQVSGNKVLPSPVGTALLALIPHPNTTNGTFPDGTPIPAVTQTVSTPTTWREELVRIDHNLTNNYRLTFRYIHDSWQTEVPNPLWGVGTSNFQDIHTKFVGPGSSFVARLNANISPTLLNEFVASYTADHIFLTALNGPPLPSGFAMGSIFNNGFGGKLPSISLKSNIAYGGTLAQDTGYFPWNNANPTYTYRDNMTKIVATHTLQFGVYFAAAQKNEENSPDLQGILTFDSGSSVSTGNSFADLLLGDIAQYQQWNIEAKYYNRYKIVEPYFQDDWRVTKRLTLNLGLRLSLFGTYRERYKHAFNFDPTVYSAANAPTVDDANGTATGFAGALVPASLGGNASGNPFDGTVQCGGTGGTFPVAGFSKASTGANSNPGCLKGHLFNPAPRFGFAFDPKGDGKMAIRGGYGIFFEHTNGNEGNTESLEGSAPFALNASQFNIVGYNNIGGSGGFIPFFPLGVNSIPAKAIWPYVQQWHLDIQKELPSHIVGTISYVGSKGTHLTLERNLNQLHSIPLSQDPYKPGEAISQPVGNSSISPDCGTTFNANGVPTNARTPSGVPITGQAAVDLAIAACGANPDILRTGFPGFSNITRLEDTANSAYNALQATAHRTLGDLTFSLAYTYSHAIDDASDRFDNAFVDSFNFVTNRASSSFDQRHSLAISYIYAFPFFKGGGGMTEKALGGWQVSGITIAQTGNPFSVTNGTTFGDNAGVGNGVGTGSRPDLVSNPHTGFKSNQEPGTFGPLAFNPAAFAIPRGLTFGNIGRDSLYLPGRVNFDFGLFKRFSINEKTGFDFRWENFNIFNHTQFGNGTSSISSALGNSDFMHLTSAHAPRRMQFGLRFYF
jgi:carboxypeptidase family protein/TonB-dependent receptor-like protein